MVLVTLLVVVGTAAGTVVDGGGGADCAGSPLQAVTKKSEPTVKSPQVLFILEM